MGSKIQVELYEGSKAIRPDILAFLDSLEFVPVQHDPRWAKVYEKLENEHFFTAVASQKGVILGVSPFTIFKGPFGAILHANPYMGYGGCSVAAGKESTVIECLMEAIVDHARHSGCITASVATPPFSETLVDLYVSALKPDYCHKKFYQYHYLNQHPFEALTRKRRSSFASEVKRAQTSGIEITQDAGISEAWLDIYEARYQQIGAKILPRAFHKALVETFVPAGKAQLHLAHKEGRLLGGTLFLIGRGIVDYFSTAFNAESMKLYPGTLILHNAFYKFIELGIKRFNWQSSPSKDSGVYDFKARWGAQESENVVMTKVLGDSSTLTERPLQQVRDAYGAHFVLPYNLWERQL